MCPVAGGSVAGGNLTHLQRFSGKKATHLASKLGSEQTRSRSYNACMDEQRKTGATRSLAVVSLCCALAIGCSGYLELDPQSNGSILGQDGEFQVGSSSMAPRLPGPRLSVVCRHCGHASEIAIEDYRGPALSRGHRCPFCGASIALRCEHGHRLELTAPTNNAALKFECEICSDGPSHCSYVPGSIVEPKLVASPKRWDCILVRAEEHGQPLLKRVLALPGETVGFEEGEFLLNGELFQKSLPEFRRVAIPVTSLQQPVGKWGIAGAELRPAGLQEARIRLGDGQKLLWQYAQPAPVHAHEEAPKNWLRTARIHDGLSQNTATSTDLRFVEDFCLSLEFEKAISQPIELECQIGERLLTFVLVPLASSSHTFIAAPNQFILEVAHEATVAFCDGRVLASAIRDHSWTYRDSAATETRKHENSCSWFSIQCAGDLVLEELELARDLYFRSDAPRLSGGQAAMEKASLDTNGYFLIGDNLVVSQDSRNGLGRVRRDDILGVIEASE